MSEIILHHYEVSPYAEKIRLVMGLKGLAWRSVQIPMVMPKPDLTALTGGYRLTPVLQLGADVYCDTQTIAAALEELQPSPTLYPAGQEARNRALCTWGESFFMNAVVLFLALGVFPDDFVEDRKTMIPGPFDPALAEAVVPANRDQVRAKLDVLEAQLRGGGFLLGGEPCLADLAVHHPIWMLRAHPEIARLVEPFPSVLAWMERVAAIGHGERSELDSAEAIEIARAATPRTRPAEDPGDPNGRKPGDRLRVQPEAYGNCPVEGELVRSDARSLALRRHDPRVGEVVVHFPREGTLSFPLG